MTYPALHVCSERCITMPFSSLLSLFWRCNVFISFKCQFCYSIFIPTLHVFISCILKMYTWQHLCLCVFLSSWKYHGSASSFFILSYLLVILVAKWVVRICCCTQICQILLDRFYLPQIWRQYELSDYVVILFMWIVAGYFKMSCPFLPKCRFTFVLVEKWALLGQKTAKVMPNFLVDSSLINLY
jgi:hypothetical protein